MKWLNKATVGTLILTGLAACSDTWDDHYDVAATTSTKTLWEQISENDKLKDFARILERVHYYTSENKRENNYTYKDMLSGTQTLTVWAPEDGTYDAEALLRQCEEGTAEEYKVEHEFVRNHINRFRTDIFGTEIDSLTMFSNKLSIVDQEARTIKENAITQANIPARNGVLHTINGSLEFQDNLLEYLYKHPDLNMLKEFIQRFDTTYIDKSQSTQGPIVNNEVTYVDEVWTTNHRLLNGRFEYNGHYEFGMDAYLHREDSLYAMIMPTDQAWNQGLAKISNLYRYRTASYDNAKDSKLESTTVNADSMQEVKSRLAIANHLAFNAKWQGEAKIENFGVDADSLTNTYGVKLKAPLCNEIFDGASPIKTSNGYAYVVNNFRFDPTKTIKKDISVQAEFYEYYAQDLPSNTLCTRYYMDESIKNPDVDGSFGSDQVLYVFGRTQTAKPSITYVIPNVLSGKYDIKLVLPPSNVLKRSQGEAPKPYKMTVTMQYYKDNTKTLARAIARNFTTSPDPDNLKNDTIKLELLNGSELFEEFPIAYEGVENAGVILKIESTVGTSTADKAYSKDFFIDEIIFESKED